MRPILCCLVLAGLVAAGCNTSPDVSTVRDTTSDPLGDVAYLDDVIYATNHDTSGHAGSQVDLFAFAIGSPTTPQDTYRVELNGQGYLAMATDGTDLYLQPRDRTSVIKLNPAGALQWIRQDPDAMAAGWRACGLCWDEDEGQLVALFTPDGHAFVVRRYDADLTTIQDTSAPIAWDILAPGTAPRAVAYAQQEFYVLGTDTTGADVVVTTTPRFDAISVVRNVGPGAVGLTLRLTQLWISYDDRRLVPWRD